jgi:hypothetical protein
MPKTPAAPGSVSRSLNDRQLTYLRTIYRLDQERERYELGAWNRGQRVRPAEEWRWIACSTTMLATLLTHICSTYNTKRPIDMQIFCTKLMLMKR